MSNKYCNLQDECKIVKELQNKIKEVKKDTICFGEGREIPVSRKHQSELRERHMNKINRLRQERSIRCTSS